MGWKGYDTTIPVGMIFKKMYCHKCGARLKKEKITRIYKKGEPGYTNVILHMTTIGMSEIAISYYIYKCPNCGSKISYNDQCAIAKKQKYFKKRILD